VSVTARLKELGLDIPAPPPERGRIAKAVRSGNLIFSSGNVCPERGKCGGELGLDEAYRAARNAMVATLGNLLEELDSLDQITRVVKLTGFVNCAEGFFDTPGVMHGASDLINDLFGPEIGYHARSAIGVYQLPLNSAVEIEMIVEVAD